MRALLGMSGMFMVACAVDVRMVPLGMEMSMVSLSCSCVCAWVGTQCCWKKWPVLPVSAIEDTMVVGEGGPSSSGKSEVSNFLIFIFVTVLTW